MDREKQKIESVKAVIIGMAEFLESTSGALPFMEEHDKAMFRTLEARITQGRSDIIRWVKRYQLADWYIEKYNTDSTYAYMEPEDLK